MAATVTLASTALSLPLRPEDKQLQLASIAGVLPGMRLWLWDGPTDGESIAVVSLAGGTTLNVRRGMDGTLATKHSSGIQVFIANPDQIYATPPLGAPAEAVLVQPYINVRTRVVSWPYGDELPVGQTRRWWQAQTNAWSIGATGQRVETVTAGQ